MTASGRIKPLLNVVAATAAAAMLAGSRVAAVENPDVKTIVEHAVEAAQRSWAEAPNYAFCETDRVRDGTRTYEVTMMLGSPYSRLTMINGLALPESQLEQERQRFEHESARRHSETPAERAIRLRAYRDERERDRVMLVEFSKAFDFSLVGQETLDGRLAYVLQATPREDYRPHNNYAKALTGMRGRGWIDVQTDNWVKISAQIVRPVSIAAYLDRVEPGTSFELEQEPVNDVWLLSHFTAQVQNRILFVFSRSTYEDETYSDYHRTVSQE